MNWASVQRKILLFSSLTFKTPTKKIFFSKLHHFSKKKVKKSKKNIRNQGFPYQFCLMVEGSRSGAGSVPLTHGSGSGSATLFNSLIDYNAVNARTTSPPHHFKKLCYEVLYYSVTWQLGPGELCWCAFQEQKNWEKPRDLKTYLVISNNGWGRRDKTRQNCVIMPNIDDVRTLNIQKIIGRPVDKQPA